MKPFYLSRVAALMLILLGCSRSSIAQTSTYNTSGGPFPYTVPPGVTAIGVDVSGAQGGTSLSSQGGKGGRVVATLAVTPGQVLNVYVGGVGTNYQYCVSRPGGANGGGNGYGYGGGGGGASDIRVGGTGVSNRVIVAGGGGGAGYNCGTSNGEYGGSGGYPSGGTGANCGGPTTCQGGQGGTQSTGGLGATCYGTPAGSLGQGANASTSYCYAGGGGGGYYGGGSGAYGGGGGGSSYYGGAGVSGATATGDYKTGGGSVVICAPNVGTLSGAGPLCIGASLTLTSTGSGGTWTTDDPSIATVSSTGVVTAIGAGTANISYSVVVPGCGQGFATAAINVNPSPAPIAGPGTVCVGSTITLTDASTGGTWVSGDVFKATVNSTTGVVTGVAAGLASITYIYSATGCATSRSLTVNAVPGPIGGSSTVCAGGGNTTLSDATLGGAWTSSSPTTASISGTGVVTGLVSGTTIISYTLPNSCYRATVMTVNPLPAATTGSPIVCVGANTNLVNTGGGTWSSSNTSQAAVAPTTGVVTGMSAGTPTITYTLGTGCYTTTNMLVNASPAALTGVTNVCEGSTTTLSSATPGGIWSSSDNVLASVTAGVVTGLASGNVTISYSLGTGCAATANVVVNPLPTPFNVTGGGGYCTGASGVHVGLNFSSTGVNYKLYNGGTLVSTVGGSNSGLDFGTFTSVGTYTAVGTNAATGCTNTMAGSTAVSINALPNVYSVTGGGNYCPGGAGVHVNLSGSELSSNYQLIVGGVAVGSSVPGTGSALDFGLQTTTGSYSVVATNPSTNCSSNMSGTATVGYNTVPTAYNVSAGGSYCTGGTGVAITLDGSDPSVTYQVYVAGVASGTSVPGTGAGISFGTRTTAGIYTIVGTNTVNGCANTMTGSSVISVNSLPNTYTVTGGGSYCSGAAGAHVGLSFAATGVDYRLMRNTTTLVATMPGTNAGLDFGAQPTVGSYSVVAVDALTGCQRNMTGSVGVAINSLPVVYTVTGGGNYCSGGIGVGVSLSGSTTGILYQLYRNGIATGPALTGAGSALNFGIQTAAGSYTVVATNVATSCTSNMSGSANVNINALPTAYNVSMAGTSASYCAGGTGIEIMMDNSDAGINYQLYKGSTAVGAVMPGVGGAISFGTQMAAGNYTVKASNSVSGCLKTMNGNVNVVVNPQPPVFTVTGGGNYCDGATTGVHIGLSGSSVGVDYQLYNSSGAVGLPVSGSGTAIDLGIQLTTDIYFVSATNQLSGCSSNMAGTATVGTYPLPAVYNTGGSGAYCFGGTGVSLSLDGSDMGIDYQLMYSGTPSGPVVAGTGSALTFSSRTSAGSYTVSARNSTTGCITTMFGTEIISVNPLPTPYAVTGGGAYCSGGAGMPVDLGSSDLGVTYQLYYLGSPLGTAMPGTGTSIGFGDQPGIGAYNIIATDDATGCVANMTGAPIISVEPVPAAQSMVGGGNYCIGGTGVHVGLGGSESGIQYQLYRGTTAVGTPVTGTGLALDFGVMMTAGTYTVVASPTGVCSTTMTGSSSVAINPLPAVYSVTGGGNYCSAGAGVHVGLAGSEGSVKYQLYRGVAMIGSPLTGTGSALDFGSQTGVGSYSVKATDTITGCVSNTTSSVSISTLGMPVAYNVAGGGNYCAGGAGVNVTLNGSSTNINYQLYRGAITVGAPKAGTGTILDFGPQSIAGTYTIVGTDAASLCTNNMNDTATVAIDPILTPVVNMVAHPGTNIVKGQRDTVVASATSAGTPTYQWYLNGFIIAGATNNSFSSDKFADRDSLTCAVMSVGTCGGVTTMRSVVIRVGSNVGVQQVSASNSNMRVTPNPSKGIFAVVGDLGTGADAELNIEVTDMVGHTIYTNKVIANNGVVNTQVQLGNVANGMYLLNVRSGMENKVFHIVVEQ